MASAQAGRDGCLQSKVVQMQFEFVFLKNGQEIAGEKGDLLLSELLKRIDSIVAKQKE